MGCRMSRTISQPDLASPSGSTDRKGIKDNNNSMTSGSFPLLSNSKESPRMTQGRMTNGQSILTRRDTPGGSLLDIYANRNGSGNSTDSATSKVPESASQADFFRMLDEKIAQGAHNLPESDLDD
uniref:Uncharacterized protein n=1 Tax=Panagrolaimus superbus TaxID=310955 RepID=A0A914YLA3_9BILA